MGYDSIRSRDQCLCKKHGYSVIKMLVKEIFGFETKIKGLPCSKEQKKSKDDQKQQSTQEQPSTMVEEAEGITASSCVASCAGLDEPRQEVDDIINEPMVKKAVELFEAKKVIVQSKV